MLPRFFIASATSASVDAPPDDPAALEDVLAIVRVGAVELIVGTELGGRLIAVEASARRRLPARAQGQLALHEVASHRTVALDAGELYVFDLQMLELLPDAPGLNDPLHLYGALRGPYPDRPTAAIEGRLTVTRADLLAGLVDGVERAFVYERSSRGGRCVHALLPGEPAEVIDRGLGLVLAFPLAHTTLVGGAANDRLAAQIFYDVLRAMRSDLGVTGVLPVPSRAALEESMVAEGWRIEGDTATRRAGDRGLVASLLGRGERRSLPPQATLEEYATEATALLARLGPPTAATAAIRRRSAPRTELRLPPRAIAPTPTPTPTPPPAPAPAPPLAPSAAPRPRVGTPRSEWLGDFATPEPKPDADEKTPAKPPPPDWSKDFD